VCNGAAATTGGTVMVRNLIPRRDDVFFPIEQAFDSFFSDFFRSDPLTRVKSGSGFPKMDVWERDGKLALTVSASGMTSEDVDVEVTPDNVLIIKGRVSEDYRAPEGATHLLRELRTSAFERRLQLPDYVEGDPRAVMKDGVLSLEWSIMEEAPEPVNRKIPIEEE
jgi:HSP20 family protein